MTKNKMNYQNGKIYTIRSHKTDLIYVGSTCQSLSKRLNKHKSEYNHYLKTGIIRYTSSLIFELDETPYIELVINYPCSCKDELNREEGKYIRSFECVNKRIEGRTPKQYREDNREKLKTYFKEYNEANKDARRAKARQKFACPCGGKYTKSHKAEHEKSIIHTQFIKSQ